ncbi:MAG: hypothetical protein FJ381_03780 [Verrucomicrobia bacterium]|nr:hypothetical protein [Verrucomicrobiota bacterium]
MPKLPPSSARALLRTGLRLFVLSVVVESVEASPERAATLEAIRLIENPRNLSRPGPGGELGPWQFKAETWRMHSTRPFADALDRKEAFRVACQHYDWICRGLAKAKKPQDPYHVALAWNSGLNAVLRGQSPGRAHRYAERAANLAETLRHEPLVAAHDPSPTALLRGP